MGCAALTGTMATRDAGCAEEARHSRDPGAFHRAPIGTRRDVIEHDLVRTSFAIARGELEDVSGIMMIAEAHTLHDAAIAYVETRNYAFRKNGPSSSGVRVSSSKARPAMAATTPISARACKSAASRIPPEACHSTSG